MNVPSRKKNAIIYWKSLSQQTSKHKNTLITPQQKLKDTKETYHFDSDTEELSDQLGRILTVATHARPMMVTVLVNSVELQMEVYTGASVSLISEASYKGLWTKTHRPRLEPSTRKLHTYTSEGLKVLGSLEVEVVYNAQEKMLQAEVQVN